MSRSGAPLSNVLADVARAVTSTQKELDRLTNESSGDLPLLPLAFVVKETQLTLIGNLFVQPSYRSAVGDSGLSFSQVSRVEASLRGGPDTPPSTRLSISIQVIEPPHGR